MRSSVNGCDNYCFISCTKCHATYTTQAQRIASCLLRGESAFELSSEKCLTSPIPCDEDPQICVFIATMVREKLIVADDTAD